MMNKINFNLSRPKRIVFLKLKIYRPNAKNPVFILKVTLLKISSKNGIVLLLKMMYLKEKNKGFKRRYFNRDDFDENFSR